MVKNVEFLICKLIRGVLVEFGHFILVSLKFTGSFQDRSGGQMMKLASIFMMLLIWSSTVYGQVDDTLVLCLSFDEGTGSVVKDSSSYHNNGDAQGTKWVDGRFGKALEFDGAGTDAVVVPDSPELRLLDGGTLMAWSYIMTESGHASWPRIMIKSSDNGGTTNGYDFLFDRAGGYSIRFCTGGECNSHFPVETDSWHHVAVTFDGNRIRAYADGEQVGEVNQIGPVVDTAGIELHIGNGAALDRPYHGIHDEIRIWSRPLEKDEIQTQMALSTTDLIAVQPQSKMAVTWAEIKSVISE